MPEHLFISSYDGALYDTRDQEWSTRPSLRPNYSRHHREIGTVADLKASLRAGQFVFPGGAEMVYLTADGACLCHGCTRDNLREIIPAIRTNAMRSGWAVGATMIDSETDARIECDHCGREISPGCEED